MMMSQMMTQPKRDYGGVSADERQESRRRLLLEACLDLVSRGGTRAVTAESVAAEAKLTKRYFYENFSDRDAILVAALDELLTDVLVEIRAVINDTERADRPRAMAEVLVAAVCRDPRRARIYADSPAVPVLQARRERAITTFTEVVADAAVDAPADTTVPRALVTRMAVAGVTDLLTSWIDGTVTADRATLIESIVAVISTLDVVVDRATKR